MPTNHGQKVDLGENAPVTQEGAGAVPNQSLAAESIREGGGFAENRGAKAGSAPGRSADANYTSPGESNRGGSASTRAAANDGDDEGVDAANGGEAPSYVQSQFRRDPNGPHGKNLTETDDLGGSGPGKSILAEPGSKQDPARLAEQKFNLQREAPAGGAGPRQSGRDDEQPYEALGRDVDA